MAKKKANTKQLGNPAAVAKIASKVKGVTSSQSSSAKSSPGFFTMLGIGLLGIIGYSLSQKVKEDQKEQIQNNNENNFSNNLNTNVLTDNHGKSYNPREIASKYKQAIVGSGTSEQALMDLARISKNGRWSNISSQYKYLTGQALLTSIQDELNTEEYNIFLTILKSPYWYAVGEYVYPKNSTVKALDLSGNIVNANVYWNVGSLGKIKAIKRAVMNGVSTEFCKTQEYPNYWIWVNDIYTKYDRMG